MRVSQARLLQTRATPSPGMRRKPGRQVESALLERKAPEVVQPSFLMELQRTAGNAAVGAYISELSQPAAGVLQREAAPAVGTPATKLPSWSDRQLDEIQRQLRRLGLYRMAVDHRFGPGTESGLIEAYAGDDWRGKDPALIIGELSAAKAPSSKSKQRFRYGELFKDGVLDMTVGLGFTEELVPKADGTFEPYYMGLIPQFEQVLVGERHFKKDNELAEKVLNRAHRSLGSTPVGEFFVLEKALTYSPPAGKPVSVDVVVRLVADTGGKGGAVKGAFTEGMAQGDVAYYTGHGRYGSGPDFDRNFTRFELLDANGKITKPYDDGNYELLGKDLAREGKAVGRSDWEQFLWRVKHKRINVYTSDLGNVLINPKRREWEFGAKLIYWALERDGIKPVTGKEGALAEQGKANPEHKYHVDVFDGCRTQDYETSIHSTAGQGAGSTDIVQTNRTVGFLAESATFASFLDSIIKHQSADQVVLGMNAALRAKEGRGKKEKFAGDAFVVSGKKYDPTGP